MRLIDSGPAVAALSWDGTAPSNWLYQKLMTEQRASLDWNLIDTHALWQLSESLTNLFKDRQGIFLGLNT